ncbi:MAG: hypothetical protein F4Y96_01215 [Chloroflexi bacterium]|nr:hypothetical protein [Chloroflexota bacterium]
MRRSRSISRETARLRLLLRTAFIAPLLLAIAACGNDEPAPDTPEPSSTQRIVFVSPHFDVWTVEGGGGNPERFTSRSASAPSGTNIALRPQQTQSVRYTWPTWSPDGRLVALSRTPNLDGNALAGLILFDADGSTERQLHETQPGSVPLVANGAPHYALWAPDSRHLSYVAPRGPGQGLGLFAVRADGGEPYEVSANAPLYHVWSPDGRYILVHRREQLLLHDTHDRSTLDLDADSFRYRVPAFSPDGKRIAYVVDESGMGKLVTSNLDGTDRVTLMDISGEAAFAWSPAGDRIAVATKRSSRLFYAELRVVKNDGSDMPRLLAPGRTAAFFWSPDGELIARAAYDDALTWQVVDPSGGVGHLTRFIPTPDFLTHIQFFDQFAPSHPIWSADSTKLVFAGAVERDVGPQVWIVDMVGNAPPRAVAEGRLAFWVPSATE